LSRVTGHQRMPGQARGRYAFQKFIQGVIGPDRPLSDSPD
jgi:hypothetical protein